MANAIVRIDVSGLYDIRKTFHELALQFTRMKAVLRERRAYLNTLRSTRRKRKEAVRRWQLAKLRVKVCEIRIECQTAEVRIVSRNLRKGEPVVMIETIFARGQSEPLTADRRTILLGHRASVAEIDECPIEILAAANEGVIP